MYDQSALTWRGLELRYRRRVVATVEPDRQWPGMWRVRIAGQLSDMVNLSRAKDAALALAIAELNQIQRAA